MAAWPKDFCIDGWLSPIEYWSIKWVFSIFKLLADRLCSMVVFSSNTSRCKPPRNAPLDSSLSPPIDAKILGHAPIGNLNFASQGHVRPPFSEMLRAMEYGDKANENVMFRLLKPNKIEMIALPDVNTQIENCEFKNNLEWNFVNRPLLLQAVKWWKKSLALKGWKKFWDALALKNSLQFVFIFLSSVKDLFPAFDIKPEKNANELFPDVDLFALSSNIWSSYMPQIVIISGNGRQLNSFFRRRVAGFPKKGLDLCKTWVNVIFFFNKKNLWLGVQVPNLLF